MDFGKENAEHLSSINLNKESQSASTIVEDVDILEEEDKDDNASHSEKTTFLSLFHPSSGSFITILLIIVNIIIFILMVIDGVNIFEPDNEGLLKWGASFFPEIMKGAYWRIVSSSFVHIGIVHLVFNMYALFYIGVLLEPYLGKARFLTAYLLTGIVASITSLWWHNYTIIAGASGAIFGMYGVFLAMLTTKFVEKSAKKDLLASIGVFVVFNLANGMRDGIDNAAHIGGLVSGIIIGYSFIPTIKRFKDANLKYTFILIATFLVISISYFSLSKIPNDISIYQKRMDKFYDIESLALEFYNLPDTTHKEKLLYEIKDRGIYYWNENLSLLDSLQYLDLPLELRTRNRIVMEYCSLRIKTYELLYKKVEGNNTIIYDAQIDDYNKQIETTINSLK